MRGGRQCSSTTPSAASKTHYSELPVVFFDEDGTGWVPDEGKSGRLRAATTYGNFDGYAERSEPVYCAMIPATGWYFRCKGSDERTPVVAWALTSDGSVHGVDVAGDGPAIIHYTDVTYEPEAGWPEEVDGT